MSQLKQSILQKQTVAVYTFYRYPYPTKKTGAKKQNTKNEFEN